MTLQNSRNWDQEFENKSINDMMEMLAPDDLSDEETESWQKAWIDAFRAKKAPQAPPAAPAAMPAADNIPAVAGAESEAARLLENHIATSARLIEYLAKYVSSDETDPQICMSFMDRMSNMLRASANVGKVVSQLRGQISRSEQAIEVAYRGRGRG